MPVINYATIPPPNKMRWSLRIDTNRERITGTLAFGREDLALLRSEGNLDPWVIAFEEFAVWCRMNSMKVRVITTTEALIQRNYNHIPTKFEVIPDSFLADACTGTLTDELEAFSEPSVASLCCQAALTDSSESSYRGVRCSECNLYAACTICNGLFMLGHGNICAPCANSSRPWYCFGCDGATRGEGYIFESAGRGRYCRDCWDRGICLACNVPSTEFMDNGICNNCETVAELDFQSDLVPFTDDELPIERGIPSLPERPFRTITIETEVDGNARRIGRVLYACGLTSTPQQRSYNYVSSSDDSFPAIFKSDSSVEAGEILLPYLELDQPEHVEALYSLMQVLKTLNEQGDANMSSSCGGHIHMAARGLSHYDLWRLTVIYGYLENTLYHLAGADDPHGHRSIGLENDEYNESHDYADVTIKGPFGTLTNFGRSLSNQQRNCGLNLSNYFRALSECGCGANRMGQPQECTCYLPKYTIEWRLWGATINPRILHCYISLMQAITAFAQNEVNMTEAEEGNFPPLPWDKRRFPTNHSVVNNAVLDSAKTRLEWMHTKLPLTYAERDSLVYTAKKSQLKTLGEDYLNGLLELPSEVTVAPKTPREERRIRAIAIPNGPQLPTPENTIPEVVDAPIPFDLAGAVEATHTRMANRQAAFSTWPNATAVNATAPLDHEVISEPQLSSGELLRQIRQFTHDPNVTEGE